jgi:hypothetical protein
LPVDAGRRRYRLLANVERLTRLPEYRRAVRLRLLSTAGAIALLIVAFTGCVLAGARPTGLPTISRAASPAEPEDIMVCVAGPVDAGMIRSAMEYFAAQSDTFTTQRIGLTAFDRRAIPLTRDYQYAKAQFSDHADTAEWADSITYADYAGGVADALALCATGFPSFERPAAQRRSIIYIGPAERRAPDEERPALYSSNAISELLRNAGVQVNSIATGPDSATLSSLGRETGGRTFSGGANIVAHLAEIRKHPPPTIAADETTELRSMETPDLPVAMALSAWTVLMLWRVLRP